MKPVVYMLMMTAALGCFTLPAQAASVTTKTTVIENKATQNPAALEDIKVRITRDLQSALAQRGYDVQATGTFDAKTDKAVRAYQADNNLPVTGEATPDIFAALNVDTTIRNTQTIQERTTIRYPLADKGSENSNVYDDPNADRSTKPTFAQRYKRITATETAPGVTTTRTTTVYQGPAMNR